MDTHTPGQPGTSPDPGPDAPPPPSQQNSFFAALQVGRTGLYRSDDRWIGGVASGLADRFGLDPLLVRALFAVSVLLGGLGLVAYGVGWAFLPEQRDGRIHVEQLFQGHFDIALIGALAMVLGGFNFGDTWFGWWGGAGLGWLNGILWGVAVVVLVVLVATNRTGSRRPPTPPGPYGPYGPYAAASAPAPEPAAPGQAPRATPTTPPPYGPGAPAAAAPAPSSWPRATSPYSSGTVPPPPYAPGPPFAAGPAPRRTEPPRPPAPPRPPRRGPGAALLGVVVALALLVLTGLLAAERLGRFDGPVALTAAGATIVLLGLGIIAAGLRGRRSGVLGTLAVLGIVVTAPFALLDDVTWGDGVVRVAGDEQHVADSRAIASAGYALGVGDSYVDLTQVQLTDETLVVPITLGAGNLTVLVPDGAAVSAEIRAGVGEINWHVDDRQAMTSGVGVGTRRYASDAVTDGVDPELLLRISIGAGDVTIEEN